jgi:hypothetical protein
LAGSPPEVLKRFMVLPELAPELTPSPPARPSCRVSNARKEKLH